jgi:diguanylate cyclase (GGDEF)-like protein
MSVERDRGDDRDGPMPGDLRQRVAADVGEHATALVGDTIGVFPFSGAELLEPQYCKRLGEVVIQLLLAAIRSGKVDPLGGAVADLQRLAQERSLEANRLFTFVYLLERSALDELALDESIGATSEPWQIVRRASFDVLAAYAERVQFEPHEASIVDKLTTVYTRPLMDAVLAKELERAGRFGSTMSIILFDVDRLSAINREHGYGVGNRILERLGILIRQYFRHQDWVGRYSDDSIIVLLTRTDGDRAADLADRVRATVQDRLELVDHRTDCAVHVTLSAAVINVDLAAGDVVDRERLLIDAECAVARAKQQGRNCVVRVDGYRGTLHPSAENGQPPYSSS